MTLIAVPTFMNLLPDMRLNSSARKVYMAFARARQGAVTQNIEKNNTNAPPTARLWFFLIDDFVNLASHDHNVGKVVRI